MNIAHPYNRGHLNFQLSTPAWPWHSPRGRSKHSPAGCRLPTTYENRPSQTVKTTCYHYRLYQVPSQWAILTQEYRILWNLEPNIILRGLSFNWNFFNWIELWYSQCHFLLITWRAASKKATPSLHLPALHSFSPSKASSRQVSLSPSAIALIFWNCLLLW